LPGSYRFSGPAARRPPRENQAACPGRGRSQCSGGRAGRAWGHPSEPSGTLDITGYLPLVFTLARRRTGRREVPEAAEWAPHVSVAYANSDGPDNAINAALSDGRGETATVRAVDLIQLGRDRHVYEWEIIETLSLGGQTED
jgi:hypothetical protein